MAKNNIPGNPEGQHSGSHGDGPKPGGSAASKPPAITGKKGVSMSNTGGGGGRNNPTGGSY